MLGQTPRLWGGLMGKEFYQELWQLKKNGKPFRVKILNRRKSGEIYGVLARITPIFEEGEIIAYMATEEDITDIITMDK